MADRADPTPPWKAYLLATATSIAALAARVALDDYFRGYPGLLLFLLPILASAYLGGLRGGLVATGLSCLASQFLLLLPLRPMVFDAAYYRALQLSLALAGLILSVLGEALLRSRARSKEAVRSLEIAHIGVQRDQAFLAHAQRLAGLGTWDLDVRTNQLVWSEETCRIFGVDPHDFAGTIEAFHALVHPDDLERVKAFALLRRSNPPMGETQYRIVRPDGEVRTLSQRGEAVFDADGGAVRRTGVVMDVTERMNALEEHRDLAKRLGRERARLSAAQSVAKVGSWETDVATGAVIWSDETHRIFETRPEEFAPSHAGFLERVHPDDRARVDEAFIRSLLLHSPCAMQHRLLMADGRIKTVEERWEASFGAGEQAVRVLGTCQDITERKRSEDALAREHGLLREAEGRYRSLFENSNDGIFQSTPKGRLITANPALAKMLRYASPEEMIGEVVDVAQTYAKPELRLQFKRQLEQHGFVRGFEYQLRRRDGTPIWVSESTRVVRDAQGRPLLYEGSIQDITERRLAADEVLRVNRVLERQKAELQVLFDLMPAMIWFKDTNDGIVRVNQRVAQALGRPVEDIEGRPSSEIYPRDAAKYREADREVIDSRVAKLGIVETLADAEGNETWVQTDKVPYFDEAGNVVGIVVMSQDVSERLRAEALLRKTHNQLVEVSRLGGMAEVATEVLHNVGNVLNSINVSASLVIDNLKASRAARMADVVKLLREHHDHLGDYVTSDPQGQHIPALLENLSQEWVAQQRLLVTELEELRANVDLIKQIVASQQSHAGAAEVLEWVGAEQLLEAAVQQQQGVLTRQHVRVVRDFASVEPIQVARHKAVQILVNLLRNARQACKSLPEADRCITLRIARAGARVAICVSDNGDGIAAENLVRIFAPGYSTRRDAGGYGLHSGALAAADMGGSLRVHSDGPGRGATFTLELPMHRELVAA